jgi:hypothetical protein
MEGQERSCPFFLLDFLRRHTHRSPLINCEGDIMSRINGEKARAAIAKRRNTAQRASAQAAKAAAIAAANQTAEAAKG